MKHILLVLITCLSFLTKGSETIESILSSSHGGNERIESYDIHIQVAENGDLRVTEKIVVYSLGIDIRQGIYRSFPTKYKMRYGGTYKVDFELVRVLHNNKPSPHHLKRRSNGVVIYAGESGKRIEKGFHAYQFDFTTGRQMAFYDDFDELYFNAIGGGWGFPIEKASVFVEFPENTHFEDVSVYSGKMGSTDCNCELITEKNGFRIVTNRRLMPGEQLTFAAAIPKGVILEPTSAEMWAYFWKDYSDYIFIITFSLGILLVYIFLWKRVGVDPKKGTIIPIFNPPSGYSPAALGYVLDMKLSQRLIAAAIVNMAVKGYLSIDKIGTHYALERKSHDMSLLSEEEKMLSLVFFEHHDVFVLYDKNHKRMNLILRKMNKILKRNKSPKYFKLNTKEVGIGVSFSLFLFIVFLFVAQAGLPIVVFGLLNVLFYFIFNYLMKAPTLEGRALMDEIEGFKMYLTVAEQRLLNHAHPPEMSEQRFEELLPYAMALKVETEWAKKFERYLAKQGVPQDKYNPSWMGHHHRFRRPLLLTAAVGSSFSSAISSASTPPSSGSGSFGGGFSGGGGGGGGGGGW